MNHYVNAQSTTGGRSGGSTASTGTGYLTGGKRPAETSPYSMTIDDEGSARNYMYVPPMPKPNRASTPDGSGSSREHPRSDSVKGVVPPKVGRKSA
ncbi:hypothetical protein GCM10027592_20470 [Spirosoma flavus]